MAKIRLQMEMSTAAADMLTDLAEREGVTRAEILRRGLLVMRAFQTRRASGPAHLGFAEDPAGLETELLGILSPTRSDRVPQAV